MLKFKKADIIALLAKLKKEDKMTLVGDHGVYIMCFTAPKGGESKRTIVYAEGCNPATDDDFYDNKESEFGGDDGTEIIGTAASLAQIAAQAKSYITVKLTATHMKVSGI